MKHMPRLFSLIVTTALVAVSAQAQVTETPPGGGRGFGGGRGAGVESGPGSSYRSPEVNADNSLTFRLRAPNAESVRVFTDMPKLGEVTVHGSEGYDMVKDEATGIWSYTTPALPPSYYQYWYVVDGLTTPDPMNTFVRPSSGVPGVYKSVVGVPGEEAEWMMFRDVPHGNLIEHQYLNNENKTARRVVVYTPPGYNTSGESYPVIYLLHGFNDHERGWTQSGMANMIMDNLIADGKAVPALIVMPFGHNATTSMGKVAEIAYTQNELGFEPAPARGRGAPGARGAEGRGARGGRRGGIGGPTGDGWSMEKEILEYVIPYVESEFRVIKDKDARAIFGYSMGGGHSTSIGLNHPQVFSYVGGFSGGSVPASITADPDKANEDYKMIFFGSGTEDRAINGARNAHAQLDEAGITNIFSEDVGYGHDYNIWRQYLYRLAQLTFRD